MSKNLSLKFSSLQFLFWSAYCCVYTFAATYLLEKGFSAAEIGWILFCGNLLSFVLQPVVADRADKSKKNIILLLISVLSFVSLASFVSAAVFNPTKIIFSIIYTIGIACLDMQIPLHNAMNVFYSDRGYTLNYSLGRGMGALAFALISLLMGYAVKYFGVGCLPVSTLILLAGYLIVIFSCPRLAKEASGSANTGTVSAETESLFGFFLKYKWYSISLFGFLFLAMFHVMTENYLIEVLRPLGGDSSSVGLALFFATAVETPGMIFFDRFYKKTGSYKVILIAGISYVLKAVCFVLAASVTAIYFAQLLQLVTYTLLSPVEMYYARECVSDADMVKGQSVITAAYALGCALGNLIGGNIISSFGVPAMLCSGIGMTVLGALILIICVPKGLKHK